MSVYMLITGDKGNYAELLPSVFGKDTNRILQDVMCVSEREIGVKKQLEELFQAISNEQWEVVLNLKHQLTEILGHDEPDLIKAGVLINRRKIIGR